MKRGSSLVFVECPNCHARVSTRAIFCPECHGRLRQPPRDLAAPVFRWSFVIFNIVMVCWTAFYAVTGRTSLRDSAIAADPGPDPAAATGTPVPGEMGLGFLVMLWALGFLVLGVCAAFTHFKRPDEPASPPPPTQAARR